MLNYRCKCGKVTGFGSMCIPDCDGCEECNTTLATGPDGHRPLAPHEWVTRYNEVTGKPYEICKNCMKEKKPVEA